MYTNLLNNKECVFMDDYNQKSIYYQSLLEYSYFQLVDYLLKKYGDVPYDYFTEESYNKFKAKKIKTLSVNRKITRSSEGLYVHHIDENIFTNLCKYQSIERNKVSFKHQKKERLVYCDIIEHMILHALIAKETELGFLGTEIYILPQICHWYIYEQKKNYSYGGDIDYINDKGKRNYLYYVYIKAFLPPTQCLEVINTVMLHVYGEKRDLSEYKNNGFEQLQQNKIRVDKAIKLEMQERKLEEQRIMREEKEYQNSDEYKKILLQISIEEQLAEQKKIKDFYKRYPNLGKHNIPIFTGSRKDIIKMLWDLKYHRIFKSKKELNSYKINCFTDELNDEVHEIQENIYTKTAK